ncbi:hypothetical protein D3C73_1532390 [compost metagenome]
MTTPQITIAPNSPQSKPGNGLPLSPMYRRMFCIKGFWSGKEATKPSAQAAPAITPYFAR